jgi:hypothetical protein
MYQASCIITTHEFHLGLILSSECESSVVIHSSQVIATVIRSK